MLYDTSIKFMVLRSRNLKAMSYAVRLMASMYVPIFSNPKNDAEVCNVALQRLLKTFPKESLIMLITLLFFVYISLFIIILNIVNVTEIRSVNIYKISNIH